MEHWELSEQRGPEWGQWEEQTSLSPRDLSGMWPSEQIRPSFGRIHALFESLALSLLELFALSLEPG